MPRTAPRMISERQGNYLSDLLTEAHSLATTEAHRDYIDRVRGSLPDLTGSDASDLIERVKGYLQRQRAAAKAARGVPIEAPYADEEPVVGVPIEPILRHGTYTVVLEDDSYVTLRVRSAEWASKPAGTVTVEFLDGPDNTRSYRGFAFADGRGLSVWRKYRDDSRIVQAATFLLSADDDAQRAFGKAYAMESGNCWCCGKKLTTPESIEAGIGPVCAGRL